MFELVECGGSEGLHWPSKAVASGFCPKSGLSCMIVWGIVQG